MGVFAFRLDVHEQQIFLLVASGVVAREWFIIWSQLRVINNVNSLQSNMELHARFISQGDIIYVWPSFIIFVS